MAEKEKENENSAGWLPEMSFQTVLSLVGVAFTAFELYQRFRPNQVLEVPKVRFLLSQNQNTAAADAEPGKLEKANRRAKTLETSKS